MPAPVACSLSNPDIHGAAEPADHPALERIAASLYQPFDPSRSTPCEAFGGAMMFIPPGFSSASRST
jgi:hypothetical protein